LNPDEKASLIALIFLIMCCWTLLTYRDIGLDADLPFVGPVKFSIEENIQYFLPVALFLAFIIFMKIRKEKEASESNTQFAG